MQNNEFDLKMTNLNKNPAKNTTEIFFLKKLKTNFIIFTDFFLMF